MSIHNQEESRIVRIVTYIIANLDAVICIVLAVVAAILSTFGGRVEYAIAATAGVLTILSIGILRDRSVRERFVSEMENIHLEVKQLAGNKSADDFFSRKTGEEEVITRAEAEIVVIQETGRRIAETCRRDLVNFLKKGGRIRWVSVLDAPPITELMAFRNANLLTPQLISDRMESGFQMIEVLANEAKANASQLEVRFFPYPTDITAVFRDPHHVDRRNREGLVRLQGFRVTYDDKLDFKINSYDSREVFDLFHEQMENIWHASSKCIFLTGRPRVGKSTLLAEVVEKIRQSTNLRVVGFITRDTRNAAGDRISFETTTIDNLRTGQLAEKNGNGRYELDPITMNEIIVPTIWDGLQNADLLVIDEIGPIQLQSPAFQDAMNSVLENHRVSVIGTVALEGHPYLNRVRQHYRTSLVEVTEDNRNDLVDLLYAEFLPRRSN